jgi:hypothetical protein
MFLNNIEEKIDTRSTAVGGETASFGDIVSAEYNAGRLASSSTSRQTALYQAYDARTGAIDKALQERYAGATSNLRNPYDVPDADMTEGAMASYSANLKALAEQYPKAADVIAPERGVEQDAAQLARQAQQTALETTQRGPGGFMQFAAENIGGVASLMRDPIQQATMLLAPEAQIGRAGLQGLLAHSLWGASKMAMAQAAAEPAIQSWRAEAGMPHGWGEAGSEILGAFEGGLMFEAGGRLLMRGTRRLVSGRWLPEEKAGGAGVPEQTVDRALQGDPAALREVSDAHPEDSALRGAAEVAEQQELFAAPEGVEGGEHLDRLAAAIRHAYDDPTAPPPGDAAALYADQHTKARRLDVKPSGDTNVFTILNTEGEAIGHIETSIQPWKKKDVVIELIENTSKYKFTTHELKQVISGLKQYYPDAERFVGDRTTGTKSGWSQIDVRNANLRKPLLDETAATAHTVEGKPVYFRELAATDLQSDAATFQFKSNGDAAGVTERLRGVTRWDPLASGKTIAFERADGSMVIADGHQRLGLAKRLAEDGQNPVLQAFVFREKDGWTPADVRAYAAMKNLKELSGTPLDMARIMRERPDLVDGSLPLSDGKMREAVGLARLSPEAFGMVANGLVPEPYAALVGDAVTDASRHASLLEEIMRASPQNVQQARLYMGQILSLPTATEHQISLFGEEERIRSLMPERVRVLDSALKGLSADKRVFGLLDREAPRIEGAGNDLARDENQARAQRAAELGMLIERLAASRGVVSDLLNDAAQAINRGVKTKVAADALVRRIGDIVDAEGLNGLTRERAPEQPAKLADALGPEADKQTEALDAASNLKDIAKEPKEGETPQEPRMMFALPKSALSPSERLRELRSKWIDLERELNRANKELSNIPEEAETRIEQLADKRIPAIEHLQLKLSNEAQRIVDKLSDADFDALDETLHPDEWRDDSGKFALAPKAARSGLVGTWSEGYASDQRKLTLFDKGGKEVGYIATISADKPPAYSKDKVWVSFARKYNESSHELSSGDIRYVLAKIADEYPDAKYVTGSRVTGARKESFNFFTSKPVIKLPRPMQDPGVTLSARAAEAKDELRGEIDKLVSKHLPADVKAVIRDRLTFGDLPDETQARFNLDPRGEFWGHFDPHEKLMYLSLAADNPRAVAMHEIGHMLEESRLIPERDLELLHAEADRLGAREKLQVDERYGEAFGERYKGDKDALEAALRSETIWNMVQARYEGREDFGKAANGILDRVGRFLRAVGNMLRGRGFQTVEDVFDRFERGEYGRGDVQTYALADGEEKIGAAMFALPPKKSVTDLVNEAVKRGELTQAASDALLKYHRGFVRVLGNQQAAAMKTAAMLQAEAALRKRQALQQKAAWDQNITPVLMQSRDGRGQADPARGLVALLDNTGSHVFPEGVQDVAGRARGVEALAISKLQEMLDHFRPAFVSGRTPDKARLDNIVRELKGQDTGDQMAKGFAKALDGVFEDLRQRFNAAGGNIGKLKNWAGPQEHSRRALIMAGEAKWKADIKPELDRAETVHPLTRLPMTDAELDASLSHIWKTITSDGWHEREISARPGGIGSLANQRGDHRFLHFKDADAWLRYNRQYGAGDNPLAAWVSHIHGMSQDIAAMEILGPNPRANLTKAQQFVTQQANLRAAGQAAHFPSVTQNLGKPMEAGGWWLTSADPVTYGAKAVKLSENMWNTFRGYTGAVVDPRLADAAQTVRNLGGAAKLGGSLFSALSDTVFQTFARKMGGMPAMRLAGDYLKGFSPDDAARALTGVLRAEHVLRTEATMSQGWNGKSVSGYLQDRVLQLGLVNTWSNAGVAAYSEGVMSHLGQEAGKSFGELHPMLQRTFKRYGLGEADWNALRSAPQNAGRIEPDAVHRHVAGQGGADERLAERYLGMILGEARYTQNLNPLQVTQLVSQTERGSLRGEAWRGMAQFRTFTGWYFTMWGGRLAAQAAAEGRLKAGVNAGGLLISLTMLGVVSNQLKAIMAGKDPEPLDSYDVWKRGLMQGGGVGIYGDFLQAAESRFGSGLAETVLGPQFAMASDALKITYGDYAKFMRGDKTNPGREAVSFIKNYTPGSNLWYLRAGFERVLLDQLQRFVDPQAHEAFHRRVQARQRDYHTGFWWRPGDTLPERAPDLGNLMRH